MASKGTGIRRTCLQLLMAVSAFGVAVLVTIRVISAYHSRIHHERSPDTWALEEQFEPTVPNGAPAPTGVPSNMVWIPGGEFSTGVGDPRSGDAVGMMAMTDSRPIHRVYVNGFLMDKNDVTNAEFERFVTATHYVTVADRVPRAEDFPGAPPQNLVAGAVVFTPPRPSGVS